MNKTKQIDKQSKPQELQACDYEFIKRFKELPTKARDQLWYALNDVERKIEREVRYVCY